MGEFTDCEHFIPLRRSELIDLLCAEEGMSAADGEQFRQFCKVVAATYHFEFNQLLEQLKNDYAAFDPDSDTQSLVKPTSEEKQRHLNELLRRFAWLLERANFKHLTREEIEPGRSTRSEKGFQIHVDWSCFEHIAVFARGERQQKRMRRRVGTFYRLEEATVPTYQRLALILKLKPSREFGEQVNTNSVYLKIFKDLPKADVKMLLPTARVRLNYFDRGRIGVPLVSGACIAAWQILRQGIEMVGDLVTSPLASPLALWGIASATAGYGYKTYYNYTQTKQYHNLTLAQSLYYQNLDSNAGVLFRLFDEAEEQQCREAFLAYFFLWRFAQECGWTSANLDDHVEVYLERYAHLNVDFKIGDAIQKLEKLGVVEKLADRYRALPIDQALTRIETAWGNCFKPASGGR